MNMPTMSTIMRDDEGTETHASETLAAVTLPDTAAVEALAAEAREDEEDEHAHHRT